MKERLSELGIGFWYAVIAVVVIAALSLGIMAVQQVVYPWWLSIQREGVENSKSFTDANNNMLETYRLEYFRLDTKIAESQGDAEIIAAYEAQQTAIIERMCRQISTMKKETVNPAILAWLNSKGVCK